MIASSADVTIRFRIDPVQFQRSMWDAVQTMTRVSYEINGLTPPPSAPYPRTFSGLTARQYRTARRRYARTLRHTRRNR